MSETKTVLLLERDLFFIVKVRDTLSHLGYETQVARSSDDFARKLAAGAPALAMVHTGLVGVDWEQAIAEAKVAGTPTLAFGSHIDLEAQQAARRAGADRVISNSKLAKDLPAIVERMVNKSGADLQEAEEDEESEEEEANP
jgi:DNA-binding response OmpR family regulator